MKRFFILLMFLFSVCAIGHSQDFVSCLILDKTGSMVGLGDGHGHDIWEEVQNYCCEWIDGLNTPVDLVVYTFDAKCSSPQCFKINDTAGKTIAKDYVRSIKADGQSTAIYSAMSTAMDYLSSNYKNSSKLVYLVTDGRDNASSMTFSQTLKKFSADSAEYNHLYYIDLRGTAKESDIELLDTLTGASYTNGFAKTASFKTCMKVVNYTIGVSEYAEQRFLVPSMDMDENFVFSAEVGEVENVNVDIYPSKQISISSLEKIEEGKYSIRFKLDFMGNQPLECEIPVTLKGIDDSNHVITFDPSDFTIKVLSKPNSIVKGGWK